MTNAQIILTESVKLMEAGILKGTGELMTIEFDDGTKKQLESTRAYTHLRGVEIARISSNKRTKGGCKLYDLETCRS